MDSALNILFADDEDSFRIAIAQFLRQTGYVVDVAESGDEAIQALKSKRYDVILLDNVMPVMSGINVLQWMLEQKNDTPVILMTGSGSESIAVEAMKLGAYDYIPKEHLELQHLPIVINGVNERNLFKKEKEERTKILRSRESIRASIGTYEKAISSLSHVANNSLTLLSLELQEYIRNYVAPFQSEEVQRGSKAAFDEIKSELDLLVSSIKGMRKLTDAMQERLASDSDDPTDDRMLKREIKARVADHKHRMNE
jgi:DNA-binding response OmpR family regulator